MSQLDLSDRSLVAQIRDGDQLAATTLYERYARRLMGLVQSQMAGHLKGQVEVDDIVQSVFKSIFRGLNGGIYNAPEGSTLWQLLAVIAIHKVRRNASKRVAAKRDSRRNVPLDGVSDAEVAAASSPEEVESAIREAIEVLGEPEQAVVLLRLEGYTVEEISQRTQRSRRTVERSLQRSRELLADSLLQES